LLVCSLYGGNTDSTIIRLINNIVFAFKTLTHRVHNNSRKIQHFLGLFFPKYFPEKSLFIYFLPETVHNFSALFGVVFLVCFDGIELIFHDLVALRWF